MGERMLRLTAKYADQWNRYLVQGNSSASEIPPLREKVDAVCREVGRDPATLERQASVLVDFINRPDVPPAPDRPFAANATPIVGSPEEIAAQLRAFADEGIAHIQIWTNPRTVEGVELLGPVLEALDKG
jgi:alkanesulfonate monooxygenase SsuD/methylene tetrahydromethanopterin reductase-like flavin-dependent oxidoreductase (luciferase family)